MSQTIDPQQATDLVTTSLLAIVPDADLGALTEDADLRDAFELDSLDFLSFVEQLARRSGQRIDEDDYDQLRTLGSCVRYLRERAL